MKENGVRLTQMKIKRGEIITTEKEGTKDLGKKKKKKVGKCLFRFWIKINLYQ